MSDEVQLGLVGLLTALSLYAIEEQYARPLLRIMLGLGALVLAAMTIRWLHLSTSTDPFDFLCAVVGAGGAVALLDATGWASAI